MTKGIMIKKELKVRFGEMPFGMKSIGNPGCRIRYVTKFLKEICFFKVMD